MQVLLEINMVMTEVTKDINRHTVMSLLLL